MDNVYADVRCKNATVRFGSTARIPYSQFTALAYVRYVENKLLRTGSELKSSLIVDIVLRQNGLVIRPPYSLGNDIHISFLTLASTV